MSSSSDKYIVHGSLTAGSMGTTSNIIFTAPKAGIIFGVRWKIHVSQNSHLSGTTKTEWIIHTNQANTPTFLLEPLTGNQDLLTNGNEKDVMANGLLGTYYEELITTSLHEQYIYHEAEESGSNKTARKVKKGDTLSVATRSNALLNTTLSYQINFFFS